MENNFTESLLKVMQLLTNALRDKEGGRLDVPRPKLSSDVKKPEQFVFRLSVDEKAYIVSESKKQGITPAKFLIKLINKHREG